MRPLQTLLLLSIVWCTGAFLSLASEIVIEADSYMPYTGDSSKGETGFMVDIAKAIWEKKGFTVTYQTKTWREALDQTRGGISTAIVGANREDAPDFLFPTVEQAKAQGTFYTLVSTSFKYVGPDSLSNYKLGIVSDYQYNLEIATYIRNHRTNPQNIRAIESSPDLLTRFFDFLEHKKIDVFIEDRNVVQYHLKSYPRPDKFTEAGALRNATPLYVAVSPRAIDGDVLVQELSEGMETLRSSGELNTILSKYGIAEITAPVAAVEASPNSSSTTTAGSGTAADQTSPAYTAFGVPIK